MRLLVVEDATKLLGILVRELRGAGYAVDGVGTGEHALALAAERPYDAVVLDLRLPDVDGFEVCHRLRGSGCWAPILMLTARDAVDDRVRGLDAGADDYLTKPFAFPELLARVRALVRRRPAERPAILSVGDIQLDPAARTVTRAGAAIDLTATEFALLEYLMCNAGVALRRRRIIRI